MIMKRHIIYILIALALTITLFACGSNKMMVYSATQSNTPVSGGIFYALPRTQVQLCLKVSHQDISQSPYHAFAKQYLSQDSAAEGYRLNSVQMSVVSSPDKKQIFYVEPGNNSVNVDGRGLLLAVNCTPMADSVVRYFAVGPTMQFYSLPRSIVSPIAQNSSYKHADTFYTRTDMPGKPSLVVSKDDHLALAQQAAAAATKLADIEEKQQQLLFGEYEGDYSSGSVQFLYNSLEEMKRPYLQQFLGREVVDSVIIYIDPKEESDKIDSQSVVIAYFSPTLGLLPTNVSLPSDAKAITCAIHCDNLMRRVTRTQANKLKKSIKQRRQRHCLRYRIPQEATVSISMDGMATVSQRLPIMQYGAAALLPYGNVQAIFDNRTGSLLHMNRGMRP